MPGAAALREAAIAHLARFSTTEAGLTRVLDRRLQRWAQRAAAAGGDPEEIGVQRAQAHEAVPAIVRDLCRIGAVDDAAFAQSRARALVRAGRSRRAIGAHLAQRGVPAETAGEAVAALAEDAGSADETEFAAALLQARRRRIGPFRREAAPGPDDESDDGSGADRRRSARQRGLAALGRAGFAHDVASRALDEDLETAEALIARLRST